MLPSPKSSWVGVHSNVQSKAIYFFYSNLHITLSSTLCSCTIASLSNKLFSASTTIIKAFSYLINFDHCSSFYLFICLAFLNICLPAMVFESLIHLSQASLLDIATSLWVFFLNVLFPTLWSLALCHFLKAYFFSASSVRLYHSTTRSYFFWISFVVLFHRFLLQLQKGFSLVGPIFLLC